VPTPIAP